MGFGDNKISMAISENRIVLMGLSMLSIMLFHQYFTSIFPFNLFHNYGHWGVDVFLFLSGMGLVNSLRKYPIKFYYLRRISRILPSCILCGTIRFFLIMMLTSCSELMKAKLDYSMWTLASMDLWFIHTIFILYVISPILHRFLNKWPHTTIFIIMSLFFIVGFVCKPIIGNNWMSPLGVASRTIERLPVFAFGMIIMVGNVRLPRRLFPYTIFLTIAACLVLVGKVGKSIDGLQACIYLLLAFGMPAFIFLLLRIIRVTPIVMHQPLIFIGTHSLELYLVHEFIFWVIHVVCINGNPFFLLLLSFTLSCFFAYIFKRVIDTLMLYFLRR